VRTHNGKIAAFKPLIATADTRGANDVSGSKDLGLESTSQCVQAPLGVQRQLGTFGLERLQPMELFVARHIHVGHLVMQREVLHGGSYVHLGALRAEAHYLRAVQASTSSHGLGDLGH
jgi:hypothetical protein